MTNPHHLFNVRLRVRPTDVMTRRELPADSLMHAWTGRMASVTLEPLPPAQWRDPQSVDCTPDIRVIARQIAMRGAPSAVGLWLSGALVLTSLYIGQDDATIHRLRADGDDQDTEPLSIRLSIDATVAELANIVGSAVTRHARGWRASFADRQSDVVVEYIDHSSGHANGASGDGLTGVAWYVTVDASSSGVRIWYDGHRFSARHMRAWADQYRRVMVQLIADPSRRLGSIDPVTDVERSTQLELWNDTRAAFPDVSLGALIRAQADRRPDATAIVYGDRRWSYREVVTRAERIARALMMSGVLPQTMVGLQLERGTDQVDAMLGVLLVGGIYVPIDPAAPPDRVSFILTDAQIRWLIVDETTPPTPTGSSPERLRLVELLADGATVDDAIALPDVHPSAAAYCLYTSGTTGRPKGVVISHRNVVRLVSNDRFPFAFDASDVWTFFHSYTFDFTVWELYCCLAHGGCLVIVSREDTLDLRRYLSLMEREHVTVLNQTPRAFTELARLARSSGTAFDRLRYVILGAEKLHPSMLLPIKERWPRVTFVNLYGPTEATVCATGRILTVDDMLQDISNIGSPLPTATVYVLDPRPTHRLLPAGAVGELYIGGLGVARGYLGRPDLESRAFIANPFGDGTLFRTGDLVRYQPDGSLEIIGRSDDQIKLHGYRIEPDEIVSRLREHESVADAVVLLEGSAEPLLVAYVQLRAEEPTAADLRSHLVARLPQYMVPSTFKAVEHLPLTEHGKLDRHALVEAARPFVHEGSQPPRTPTAQALAEVWSNLLGTVAQRGDDSFFELGGHSLLAVRLVELVAQHFGVEVPLSSIFGHPGLQELADMIDRQRDARAT